MKYSYIAVAVIIFGSCNPIKKNSPEFSVKVKKTQELNFIDIDPRKFQENELKLTDISANVTYIPLDNTCIPENS
jgi:hypothetical protein